MNFNTEPIVATEFFCIVVCFILFYGNQFENHQKTLRFVTFSFLSFTNIFALLFDALTWVIEEVESNFVILNIVTGLSIILSFVMIAEFVIYLYAYMLEKKKVSKKPFKIFLYLVTFSIILTTAACLSGHMFTYGYNSYTLGDYYPVYTVTSALCMFAGALIVVVFSETLGVHDTIASLLYISIPTLSAVVAVYIEDWPYTYPACTLALLTIYVMIQVDNTNKLEKENEQTLYYAMHDELTGMFSRRAYIDRLNGLSKRKGNVAVLFSDINGLKYTNDHFGHEAGDQLIIHFSDLLNQYFDKENIYRISGDEFVVLLADVSEKNFEEDVKKIAKKLDENGRSIASIGYEYGSMQKVEDLVRMAESRMYQQKEQFYLKHKDLSR